MFGQSRPTGIMGKLKYSLCKKAFSKSYSEKRGQFHKIAGDKGYGQFGFLARKRAGTPAPLAPLALLGAPAASGGSRRRTRRSRRARR